MMMSISFMLCDETRGSKLARGVGGRGRVRGRARVRVAAQPATRLTSRS